MDFQRQPYHDRIYGRGPTECFYRLKPVRHSQNGFSYTLRNGAGAVRAVLSALSSKTNVKVIASPSLMVLDNHQAAIAVGSQYPVQTATYNFLNQENPNNSVG